MIEVLLWFSFVVKSSVLDIVLTANCCDYQTNHED